MKIFIIHNEEPERLNYLIPQAEGLAKAFRTGAGPCAVELIGPDERNRRENLVPNTFSNRLRRARDAARLFAEMDRSAPSPNSPIRKTMIGWRMFKEMMTYERPLTIEQDVVTGHAECWKRITREGGSAIVMENDAIFRNDSAGKLIKLIAWLKQNGHDEKPFYVDLAGGCDRHKILNAWCFEKKFGGKKLDIEGFKDTTVFLLPKLANNTACAYYINAQLTQKIYAWYKSYQPKVGVDWTVMLWAAIGKNTEEITCIHCEPPILIHGSVAGEYIPWG